MLVRTIASAGLITLLAAAAAGQPYDGVTDCQHHASAFHKARDSDFIGFAIDRSSVEESAFEDSVGSQYVTAVFRGRATYTDRRGKRSGTFICLHAGSGKGAVFVYFIPR